MLDVSDLFELGTYSGRYGVVIISDLAYFAGSSAGSVIMPKI